MIAWTSRLALRSKVEQLRGLQLEVYAAIRDWPGENFGPSLQELAVRLGRKESSMCGRLAELRTAGCIENGPLKPGDCGHQVMTYKAVVWLPEQPLPQIDSRGQFALALDLSSPDFHPLQDS